MAFVEIKQGEDTSLMREVVNKISGRLGPDYAVDDAWYLNINKKAELKKEKLETELNSYRVYIFFYSFAFLNFRFCCFQSLRSKFNVQYVSLILLILVFLFAVFYYTFFEFDLRL